MRSIEGGFFPHFHPLKGMYEMTVEKVSLLSSDLPVNYCADGLADADLTGPMDV